MNKKARKEISRLRNKGSAKRTPEQQRRALKIARQILREHMDPIKPKAKQ